MKGVKNKRCLVANGRLSKANKEIFEMPLWRRGRRLPPTFQGSGTFSLMNHSDKQHTEEFGSGSESHPVRQMMQTEEAGDPKFLFFFFD